MSATTNYGTDYSCVTDLTSTLAQVSGRTLLAQAVARRVSTPRGSLFSNPNYGIDLTDFLNDGLTVNNVNSIAPIVDAELSKDERIISTATTCTLVNGVMNVAIIVTDADGPFLLVLAVSDVTVSIIQGPGALAA
jgi:phage baseplate assembly protein W